MGHVNRKISFYLIPINASKIAMTKQNKRQCVSFIIILKIWVSVNFFMKYDYHWNRINLATCRTENPIVRWFLLKPNQQPVMSTTN